MSDIVSRPYNPKMACERCAFNRGPHALWCPILKHAIEAELDRVGTVTLYGRLPGSATHCTMTTYISKSQALNRVNFISPRVPNEPTEEWAKRCAVITNVKEPE